MTLVVALAALAVTGVVFGYIPIGFSDFRVYLAGAGRVLAAEPLYAGEVIPDYAYTYPPFSALLFVVPELIRSLFTEVVLYPLWVGVIVASLWYLLLAAAREATGRADLRPARALAVPVVLTLLITTEPTLQTLQLGQVNLLLAALVVRDLTLPRSSRWRGVGIGLAAGIKLTPLLFLVVPLLRGDWRHSLRAGLVFGGTVALGFALRPADSVTYWGGTLLDSSRIGPLRYPSSQSLSAILARTLGVDATPWAQLLPAAAVLALLAFWGVRRLLAAGLPVVAALVTGMTMNLVSPFSWGHHWVWFAPLIVWIGLYAVRVGGRARAPGLVAAAVVWLLVVPYPSWVPDRPGGRSARGIGVIEFEYGTGFWSLTYPLLWLTILVVVLLLVRAGREGSGALAETSPAGGGPDPRRRTGVMTQWVRGIRRPLR